MRIFNPITTAAALFLSLICLPIITAVPAIPVGSDSTNSLTTTATDHFRATVTTIIWDDEITIHNSSYDGNDDSSLVILEGPAPTPNPSTGDPGSAGTGWWSWGFLLYAGTMCSSNYSWGVVGNGLEPCTALSPPQAWLGLRPRGVSDLTVAVELYHDMTCGSHPVFTMVSLLLPRQGVRDRDRRTRRSIRIKRIVSELTTPCVVERHRRDWLLARRPRCGNLSIPGCSEIN